METLGKYTILETIGKGGFGTVYRAQDRSLDRFVALKVLHPNMAADVDFLERFRLEAKISARFRHPNLVGVYSVEEDGGRFYIAMEYMPGGSLQDRLARDGRMSFAEARRILLQVCAGLQVAHSQGLVHRDIKPGNILFSEDGQAVVSDFGLVKAASLSSGSASSMGAVGTPFYKAPELWLGRPPATPATDVYSLGCVLYEMLSGRLLFPGDTPDEVITRHLVLEPEYAEDWASPDSPPEVEALVRKALQRDPGRRFKDAAELARELEGLQAVILTKERDPGTLVSDEALAPTSSTKEPTRSTALLRSANPCIRPALILLSAVLLVVLLWLGYRSLSPGKERAAQQVQGFVPSQAVAGLIDQNTQEKDDLAVQSTLVEANPAAQNTVEGAEPIEPLELPVSLHTPQPSAPSLTAAPEQLITAISTATPTPAVDLRFPPAVAQLGDTWKSPVDGMELMYISAGDFQIGCDPEHNGWLYCRGDEKPLHTVTLYAYYIDKMEVTNAQYAMCVAAGACDPPSKTSSYNRKSYYGDAFYANYPVIHVSWDDASKYCEWAGRQLPTEAQWEKAARGESVRAYPWGDASPTCELVNGHMYSAMCVGDTTAVGGYPLGVSAYGVLDMAGNVWEWVYDWYSSTYYSSLERFTNPVGPNTGTYKVVRGGSFYNYGSRYLRTAGRDFLYPVSRSDDLGFRCAAPPAP